MYFAIGGVTRVSQVASVQCMHSSGGPKALKRECFREGFYVSRVQICHLRCHDHQHTKNPKPESCKEVCSGHHVASLCCAPVSPVGKKRLLRTRMERESCVWRQTDSPVSVPFSGAGPRAEWLLQELSKLCLG